MARERGVPPRWWYPHMYLWLGGQGVWMLWLMAGDNLVWRQVVSGSLFVVSVALIAKLEHDRRRRRAAGAPPAD